MLKEVVAEESKRRRSAAERMSKREKGHWVSRSRMLCGKEGRREDREKRLSCIVCGGGE